METFKLSLRNRKGFEWQSRTDEILGLKRRYQRLEGDLRCEGAVVKFRKVAQQHGSHVRVLKTISGFSSADLTGILESIPLVESLTFTSAQLTTIDEAKVRPAALRQLNHLQLNFSSWKLFDYLDGSQISSLKIVQGIKADAKSLTSFLTKTKHLQTLDMDAMPFEAAFDTAQSEKFPFKLRKLKITTFLKASSNVIEQNFNNFLRRQETLREVELRMHTSEQIMRTVLERFDRLESLKLYASSLPSEGDFYALVKPLKSLRQLEVFGEFTNNIAAAGIIGMCPNLEVLDALRVKTIPSLLPVVVAKNPKIKSLSIATVDCHFKSDSSFERLKIFRIHEITDEEALTSFITKHRSIEILSFERYSRKTLSNGLENVLTSMPKLKRATFNEFQKH